MTSVNGSGCFEDLGPAGATVVGCSGGTVTGLNFAAAQVLDLTATWSAANASNTITAYAATGQ
jgi:hypothetical protein